MTDLKALRKQEQAKYVEAYKSPHYRMGDARRAACKHALAQLQPAGLSLVDIGCGRGEFLRDAFDAGCGPVWGVECTQSLVDLSRSIRYGEITALPLASGGYDIVTCFDVLEHLPPADTELALSELRRIGRSYWLISAADYSHCEKGVEYHVNARPHPEWEALFRAVWPKVTRVQHPFGDATALWRCEV